MAHTRLDALTGELRSHSLEDHLLAVGQMAATHGVGFGPNWAAMADRWHDLGKYRPGFQQYIRQEESSRMTIDTEIRHVTKVGANLFLELGFSAAEAKKLNATSRKRINDPRALNRRLPRRILSGN